ncbi:MAG: hypothetical protein M5U09_24995 [Gammaproteobacteria bacterium]|nr:hypothetical protein [Gammaproteobacteria bacterium]
MTICVDSGTTTTLVAISEGDRSPELLRIGELDAWMPSVVTWLDDATVVVGEEAERLEGAGILTWRAAKLDLTHKPDKCRRLQTGRWVSGWEAMRHLLAEALRRCVDQVQMDSQQLRNHKLTLACSAHAGSRYREGLVRVARELGFGGTSLSAIHDEPSAAALTLARYDRLIANTGAARQVLIYDFGGGTFDAAVVRVSPDRQVKLQSRYWLAAEHPASAARQLTTEC